MARFGGFTRVGVNENELFRDGDYFSTRYYTFSGTGTSFFWIPRHISYKYSGHEYGNAGIRNIPPVLLLLSIETVVVLS